MNQMSGYFGIGFRIEHVAFGQHLFFDWLKVFDDAVVNNGDAAARYVRVCVRLGHTTMRCPTCMCDADSTVQRIFLEFCFELGNLADGTTQAE